MDAGHRPVERRARARRAALAAAALAVTLAAAGCGTTPPPAGDETACPLPAYPTAACTGVPAGTTLTTHHGGLVVTTPGQVIDGLRITGNQMMHTAVPLIFGAVGSVVGYAAVFFTNAACVAASGSAGSPSHSDRACAMRSRASWP